MKHIFKLCVLFVAAVFFAACDPTEKTYDNNALTYSSDEVADLVSFSQADADGNPQTDGNYITYYAKTGVTLYNLNSDGSENILARGSQGSFKLSPSRGSDPNQTVYIRVLNPDMTTVKGSVVLNVAVAADLSPQMKLLCSNGGSKTWKWNPIYVNDANPAAAWGNGGYKSGLGEDFAAGANNWFGCSGSDDVSGFGGQLQHSDTGTLTGEEDLDAYMELGADGSLKKYDKNGTLLGTGTFEVTEYNPSGVIFSDDDKTQIWSVGTLTTSAGAILWPFEINWRDNGWEAKPTTFEIIKLTTDEFVLVKSSAGAQWGECTYWRFKAKK